MSLPRGARVLVTWLTPAAWHESIAGDLEEEQARRRAQGRHAGVVWAVGAAMAVAVRLAVARRQSATPAPRRGRALGGDVPAALRSLARRPGYAAAVVATLALGIGANASLFTFANWLLFRPIPGVVDQNTLVTIGFGNDEGTRLPISIPDFARLGTAPAVRDLAGHHTTAAHVASRTTGARRIYVDAVTSRYFDVLGPPAHGRGFTRDEGERPAAPPVAVISDRLWRRDFGADPSIVGQTMTLNRAAVTIVGIAAPGFHGASLTASTDVWIPIAQHALVLPMYPASLLTNRRMGVLMDIIARVTPGADAAAIASQLEVVRAQLVAENPGDTRIARWRYQVAAGAESNPWQRGQLTDAFAMLGAMAVLLLVLTGANAGQLLIARTVARRAELSTRLALGASRTRLARLLFVEVLCIATAAGLAALATAAIVAALAQGTTLLQSLPPLERPAMDWRVLSAAILISTAVAMAAGLFPLLGLRRLQVADALRDLTRSHTASRAGIRRTLAAAQVVLSLALVVGALLLSRSIAAKLRIDPGFDPTRVLTVSIDPGVQRYGDTRPTLFVDLVDRIRAVPGVRTATVAWLRPSFHGVGSDTTFRADGAPADAPSFDADTNRIAPGYFDALALPIVEGRDFTDAESGPRAPAACQCVVMTESLARRVFGGAPAVGRQLIRERLPAATVIGVVRDTRQRNLLTNAADMVFEPFVPTAGTGFSSIVVALHAPSEQVAPAIARAVASVDPTLPVYDALRVDDAIRLQFADDRLLALLARVFAALATVVAAIGLAGILGRMVAERRREIGIRMALGASPRRVVRLVTSEAILVLGLGIPAGLALSWWLAGLLSAQLFGVGRGDVISFAGGVAIVISVVALCATPTVRRASRLDPTVAMRE